MSDFKLNKEQEKAVTFGDEPLIIIAGAGTGKTRVITERIVWLIDQGKAKPDEILALTFTEKAANEMQERVDIALPLGYSEVFISTFHSFCDRILKQDGIHIGMNPNYKLMNQSESTYFLTRHIFDFDLKYFRPLSTPTKFVEALLKHFSRLQDEDISPNDYEKFAEKISKTNEGKEKYPHVKELSDAYKKYVDLKVRESMLDFADLISSTLKLFRERPNILRLWQQKFKYILVDEFQDTNYAQYEVVKLLAGKVDNTEKPGLKSSDGRNVSERELAPKGVFERGDIPTVTVVADDDQSIYRFRGAAVSNVLQFRKDFPEAKSIVLTENYRSNQEILDKSYQVIKKNDPDRLEFTEKINKKLTSSKESGKEIDSVKFNYFLKAQDEAEWIAEEILKLTGGGKKNEVSDLPMFKNSQKNLLSDIAILVRSNAHSDEIIQALRYHGIPYQFGGVRKLFLKQEIKDMINILKVLVDYSSDPASFGLLSFDIIGLEASELIEINKTAKSQGEGIFKILESISDGTLNIQISQEAKDKIKILVDSIHKSWERINEGKNTGEILLGFIKDSGYLENLTETSKNEKPKKDKVVRKSHEGENDQKVQNIARFFDFIKGFENVNREGGITGINQFVEYIDLVSDLGDSPSSEVDIPDFDAVHIITVHSAKGLEFPVVFLPCLAQGRFPSINRSDQIPIPEELIKEILPQGDAHIQEERRLFYVGMTRAQENLCITSAQYYGAGKRKSKISPFVVEAFGEKEVLEKMEKPYSYEKNLLEGESVEELEEGLVKYIPSKNLSYSQIETYEDCPKKYKYRYILKVPTPIAPSLTFGSVIHNVLKDFYEVVKKSQQGFEGFREIPELKEIKEIFEKKWDSAMSNAMGAFRSKTYREKMHRRGLDALEQFYKKLYSEDEKPFMLEQPFKLKVGEYTLGGKIDRVDIVGFKDGKQIVSIIDYKTGQVKDQKKVDKDLQLAIYAMAAREVFKLEPETLSLMFVEEGLKVETTDEKMKKIEKSVIDKVQKVGEGLKVGRFGATPGNICKYCEFKDICEDAIF